MAVYKVPQDVEAEDKLIGPFGFRQFIYLIIVAFACFIAYILSKIFIGLVLIPLPFIIFFTAIALPLRKDQPTEVYLAAILQFHLKSKKRMWMPDGVLSTVEITAPKVIEESRVRDITQDEALERLNSLAQIMDTRGWAARGVFNPDINSTANIQLSDQALADAAQPDMMDDQGVSAQSFDQLIDQQKAMQRQVVQEKMIAALQTAQTSQAPAPAPAPAPQVISPAASTPTQSTITSTTSPPAAVPQQETEEDRALLQSVQHSPYPSAMHQQVIQPLSNVTPQQNSTPIQTAPLSPQAQIKESTSDSSPSPDIIELANSPFSVATIAHEAHRQQESKDNEVEIKLH